MSEKSNIRDKFGVDYLTSGAASSSSQTRSFGAPDLDADRTLAAFGDRILRTLGAMPAKQGRVFDLVDQTGLKVETLLSLTDRLSSLGLLRIVDADKYGNHEVQLTAVGEATTKSG